MIDRLEGEVDMLEWNLDILMRVIEHEPIGIVKLSNQGGYEQHEVRYSFRILEENGIIEPLIKGRLPPSILKSLSIVSTNDLR